MCFRDMTFCSSPCANASCRRRYTPEISEAARRWWGGDGAPVALADFAANGCAEYLPKESSDE